MTDEYWYRCEYRVIADYDYDPEMEEFEKQLRLIYNRYRVISHTSCGVQLDIDYKKTRFVLKDAKKKYACSTKEEALISFVARKKRQLAILISQTAHVRAAIKLGLKEQKEKENGLSSSGEGTHR